MEGGPAEKAMPDNMVAQRAFSDAGGAEEENGINRERVFAVHK